MLLQGSLWSLLRPPLLLPPPHLLSLLRLRLGILRSFRLGFWVFPRSARLWVAGLWLQGGSDFRAYLASYCPHLYSNFRADFTSGSSRFLAALASASLPLPSSAVPVSVSSAPLSSLPPAALVTVSSSLLLSAPPLCFPTPSLTSLPSSAPSPLVFPHFSLSSAPGFSLPGGAVPGGSAVAPGLSAVPVSLPTSPPPSAPSLFCPFAADPAPSAQVPSALPSAPLAPDLVPGPSFSAAPLSFLAASSASFVAPEGAAPDALPRDEDSAVPAAVPESVQSEFQRMLALLVDLFLQAVGSHSAPPPRALFEDFFGSSAPPSPPIYLSWFERVCMALADADARLASFLSSGRSDFSFLPPRNSSYAVKGDFPSGQVVPVNPLLLSLHKKQLKPSYHIGLTVREAVALESSLRCHADALSHSMWVLFGLLGFVRLQNFAPADVSLFNTLITSSSKSLAHQASLCASHTAFMVLKRRHFYLSHLPAYFSDTNKRSMLAAPAVCADYLFAEAEVARLLSGTQTASSLKS